MTTATIERKTLHKMIDELPQERESVLRSAYEILCEFDDEPLTDEEIEQIEASYASTERRSTWEEIWQKHLALS